MKIFQNLPIHKKLTVIIMLVTLSTLLLASTALVIYDIYQVRQIMSHELVSTAHLIGNRSSAALIFDDKALASENLHALQDLPQVNLGCIYLQSGELFSTYSQSSSKQLRCPIKPPDVANTQVIFGRQHMQLTLPIYAKESLLGFIHLRSSMILVNQRIQKQIMMIVLLIFVVALFAFWLSRKLQKIVSDPLTEISNVATRIAHRSDFSQRAPAGGFDELGQLSNAFNAMLNTIEQQNFQLIEAKNNLEIQVRNRTTDLEVAIKELESFSYTVTHDLRAPLRSISGFSQILLEDYNNVLDAEGQDILARVIKNTQRMSELINDIMELSKIERKNINVVAVDLDKVVAEVITTLRNNDKKRNVEIQCDELGSVIADQRLLKIAVENILGNAWKYTSKKDNASIKIGQELIDDEQVFYVKDNGAGFNMTYVDKIFSAFQRLHGSTEFEGTGIGLATVQRIIKRHGGRIWAEAEAGKGAAFYFTLSRHREPE